MTVNHAVTLSKLTPMTTYYFDVESTDLQGHTVKSDNGGQHYTFTTQGVNDILIVDGSDNTVTYLNYYWEALDDHGWSYTTYYRWRDGTPTLAYLQQFKVVFWDIVEKYPPLDDSDMDTLKEYNDKGGRLFITSHDLAWAFGDPQSGYGSAKASNFLKYQVKVTWKSDPQTMSLMKGVSGDPLSGAFTSGVPYKELRQGGAGDEITSNNAGGTTTYVWKNENNLNTGIRWESSAANGTAGQGVWGGTPSKVVFESQELFRVDPDQHHGTNRGNVFNATIVWLLGGYHPKVKITTPRSGETYSGTINVAWSAIAFGGKSISKQTIYYSEDNGQTMKFLTTVPPGTFTYAWDTTKVNNSNMYCLKVVVEDSGKPPLSGSDMVCKFTIANQGTDKIGPIVVPGSIMISPNPAVEGSPFVVEAIIDDTYRGSSAISAAELHIDNPNPTPGTGTAMSAKDGSFNSPTETVIYNGPHNTAQGTHTLTIFGKDAAGNWGPKLEYTFNTNPKGVGPGMISGKIKDKSTGAGISGAIVVAYESGTNNQIASTSSGASGDYTLSLPPGKYDVNASATGYYANQKNGIDVTPGNNTAGQDIELTPIPGQQPGSISGTVTSGGAPLEGATLIAYESGTSNQKGSATTDSQGKYKITNLPPGKYDVNASKSGYESKQQNGITVNSGQDTPNINFDLAKSSIPPGAISGKVLDQNGAPIVGAVAAAKTGGAVKNQSVTWSGGFYLITELPPAIYSVNVSKAGCTSVELQNINVESGKTTKAPDAVLKCTGQVDTGTITGTVIDRDTKNPLADVKVDLKQGGTVKKTTNTNSAGKYILADVEVGTYDLVFNKTGYNDQTITGVTVIKGQTTTIDIQMIPKSVPSKATITGTVTDKNTHEPIPDVVVTLWKGSTNVDTTNTDANGIYTFSNLDPGTYDLKFNHSKYLEVTKTGISAPADKVTTVDVEMIAKSVPGKATITGTVTDKNTHEPIPDVVVTLWKEGTKIATTRTDTDGIYTFTDIEPGTYDLKFTHSKYVEETRNGISADADKTTTVDIEMEPKSVPPPEDNTMLILAGAIIMIVIIVAIVIAILLMRRKRSLPQYPPEYLAQYPPRYMPPR
jgi:protocatechuate 3,4-dioxygenase beta subunit